MSQNECVQLAKVISNERGASSSDTPYKQSELVGDLWQMFLHYFSCYASFISFHDNFILFFFNSKVTCVHLPFLSYRASQPYLPSSFVLLY